MLISRYGNRQQMLDAKSVLFLSALIPMNNRQLPTKLYFATGNLPVLECLSAGIQSLGTPSRPPHPPPAADTGDPILKIE